MKNKLELKNIQRVKDIEIDVEKLEDSGKFSSVDKILNVDNGTGPRRIVLNFPQGSQIRKEAKFGNTCNCMCWTGQYVIGLIALGISIFTLVIEINNLN